MRTVSPTQITKARSCWRKWAFDAFDPIPVDSEALTVAAAAGTALHTTAEAYHKHAQAPDPNTVEGRAFMAALPYLPAPKTGTAEGEFVMHVSGVAYGGFVDLAAQVQHLPMIPYGTLTGPLDRHTMPAVLDYKSKSAIRRGERRNILEGEGDFYNDAQTLTYGLRALIQHPDTPAVYMRWLYIQRLEKVTQKPKVFASDCVMHRKQTAEAFGRIVHPIAKTIVHLRQYPVDPLTLPPSPATCLRYGIKYACQYISRCNLGSSASLAELDQPIQPQGNPMDLLESLRKTVNNAPIVATPSEVVATKGINPPKDAPGHAAPARATTPGAAPDATSDAELGRAVRALIKAWHAR